MIRTYTTTTEAQTERLAEQLAPHLEPGDVLALQGELGAGKTCFVRGLAKGLGIEPSQVSSPTFVICNVYENTQGKRALNHVDVYRLGSVDELETIGWSEMLEQGEAVIAVEWADRIQSELPEQHLRITIGHLDYDQRRIIVEGSGSIAERLRDWQPDAPQQQPRQQPDTCRTCGEPIAPDVPHHPFCSPRCRHADLHAWFNDKYAISRPVDPEQDLDQ